MNIEYNKAKVKLMHVHTWTRWTALPWKNDWRSTITTNRNITLNKLESKIDTRIM